MSVIPPPPPPPKLSVNEPKLNNDNRAALLKSIQQGKQLKKTQANDKTVALPQNGEKSEKNVGNMKGVGDLFANGFPKLKKTVNHGWLKNLNQTNDVAPESYQGKNLSYNYLKKYPNLFITSQIFKIQWFCDSS